MSFRSAAHSGPNYTHGHAANLGLEVSITSTDDEPSIGIVSPTPRAFTFAHNTFSLEHLDGPTPRAFTFPEQVHESLRALPISAQSQSQNRLSFASSEATASTPSTSPSPFQDDASGSPSPELARLAISSRRPSLQVQRTESPAAQINPFNAFEPSLASGPITLAHRRRGSSISSLQLGPAVSPHAQAPPQTHTLALGGIGIPERRPKRGDEDYIKRPENAFILFRRDCCQKRNADALANGGAEDPNVRRQRQADLSKTISQQWRSLSAEERKHWDDLAKQRKKEHEDMYPWYVYQPSRSKEKKGKGKAGEDEGEEGAVVEGKSGKTKREGKDKERREERKKERKERREKSHSRVRSSHGLGQRSRNQSACSTASTASSCSTVDSDDFDSGSEVFAGQYRAFRNDMDMNDMDFEMTDSESSASFSMALPPGLSMSQQFQLSTQNPMTQFVGQGHHGHGHGHSLSAQIPAQQIQHLGPPLSFVLPQSRRSTSAPGAPTPPPQPNSYPSIKLPQLLPTNASNANSPASGQESQDASPEHQHQQSAAMLAPPAEIASSASSPESRASSEGVNQEQQTLQSYQFPPNSMEQMNFANLSGQVPAYSNANSDVLVSKQSSKDREPQTYRYTQSNQMYSMYEQQRVPMTARPARPRALTQLSIPHTPSVGGPLSAPAQEQPIPQLTSPSSTNSSAPITPQRLYLPSQQQQQQQHLSPTVQSPHHTGLSPSSAIAIAHMHHGPVRAMPMNLPESPKPGHDWEAYELPSWALSTLCPAPGDEQQHQQQSDSTPTPDHAQGNEGMDAMGNGFLMAPPSGEIEIDFSSIPFSFDNFTMGTGEPGMDFMGDYNDVDPLLNINFRFDEDLLDPSQL